MTSINFTADGRLPWSKSRSGRLLNPDAVSDVYFQSMKTRLVFGAAILFLLPSMACDSDSAKTYPVTFVCEPTAGTVCPPGTECPALPLGADTCGDLPGGFGHPATPVTKGRPVGCMVGLSYGNPYWGDTQQTCSCTIIVSSPSSPAPQWVCAG